MMQHINTKYDVRQKQVVTLGAKNWAYIYIDYLPFFESLITIGI